MSSTAGSASDKGMFRVMVIVVGALVGLLLFIFLIARILGGAADDVEGSDTLMRNAMIQRLEPVGQVRTSAEDLQPADTPGIAVAAGPVKTGEELVQGACANCHAAAVAGAPALDDDAAWAVRREKGFDALFASALNGLNAMPARGGSTYTDDEIARAVRHIAGLEEAPTDSGAADSAAADPAPAATEAIANEMETTDLPAGATADGTVSEGVVAEAPDTQVEEAVDAATVADLAGAVTGAGAVDALVVGEVPENLTDNVKTMVDGVCAGCHIAGIANAPKIGDVAAWQERADTGLAALTSSVINGKGAMPARGGSALTDDEIPMAIQYLMSKK